MIRNIKNILVINYIYDSNKLSLFVEKFENQNPFSKMIVLTQTINLNTASTNFLRIKGFEGLLPKEVIEFKYTNVYIINNEQIVLENTILHEIFNKDITKILFIDSNMLQSAYEPYKNKQSKSILVFPGPMIPLYLGSHQRAFNLVNYLNKQGFFIDILITGNQKKFKKYENILKAISPNVYMYKNTKRKYPRLMRVRRKGEKLLRKFLGDKKDPSDLFSERDFRKPTVSCRRTLERLVNVNNYNNIIISYAWMIKAIENISKKNIKFICDTHDVQFIRNETQNKDTRRFFINPKREKKIEIDNLKLMDSIIAISNADYNYFQNTELKDKTILGATGFNYIHSPVKYRTPKKELIFGFIGTNMFANTQSLEYILNYWWSEIKQYSPNSKLMIAGSICNNEDIVSQTFLDNSIELLGFVNSTKEFYNNIDIALNPVIVAGGLNFKSVEPLIAGKHLITNSLGFRSLSSINGLKYFDSIESIIEFLSLIEIDLEYDYKLRKKLQQVAFSIFKDKVAYKNIVEVLESE